MLTRRAFGIALAAGAFLPTATRAQSPRWPDRAVTIIQPFAPGGGTDNAARLLSEELKKSFGQTFVVDTRPGAAGNIGARTVVQAAPDGYTLLCGTEGILTINPHIYKDNPVNAGDLVPISTLFFVDTVLVINPKLPFNSMKELIAFAKDNPGKLTYGSSGAGTAIHLWHVLLEKKANIQLRHVPYKGSAQALTDVIAGNIDILIDAIPSAAAHINAGTVRAIAVGNSKRSDVLPDLPTIAEAGVDGYVASTWGALLGPKGTPDFVVQMLQSEIQKIYADPVVKKAFADRGLVAVASTPAELSQLIKNKYSQWGDIVKAAGIQPTSL